jgi:chitinase
MSLSHAPVLPGIAAVLVLLLCASSQSVAADDDGKRVVGYWAGWSSSRADELPGALLTHVNYAFARVRDGECSIEPPDATPEWRAALADRFRQLQVLKQNHPHIKTLISIGGWGGSDGFSDAALTDSSRLKFARSCAAFIRKNGFDGVDIDWEYPTSGAAHPEKGRPEDTRNFTLLLSELRRQLDEQAAADQMRYLLTIAAPAGPDYYKHIELGQIHPHLDFINVMTYDFAGSWSAATGFNSPLFAPDANAKPPGLSVDASVRAYLAAGIPAAKVVVGVPFYGRAFGGVKNVEHGLFQPHDKSKSPRPTGGDEWTYRVIAADGRANKTMTRYWHDAAKVPWLHDEKNEVMITYDDPESIRLKAQYVRERSLSGVMIWELSQDDEQHSLLKGLNAGLAR